MSAPQSYMYFKDIGERLYHMRTEIQPKFVLLIFLTPLNCEKKLLTGKCKDAVEK